MTQTPMTRDQVSQEALYILQTLQDNARAGRSNKLADVKSLLETAVSLEFDSYFFFLRKYHYIAMDREAQLKLTDQGDKVAQGEYHERFGTEVDDFFADQISPVAAEDRTQASLTLDEMPAVGGSMPPPPPPSSAPDIAIEPSPPMPQSTRGGKKPPAEEPYSPLPPPVATPSDRGFPGLSAPMPLPPVASVAPSLSSSSGPTAQPVGGGKGQDIDLRYVKYDALGAGPLGTVFKGKHNALGLDICVKELKDIFGYFSFLQRGEVIKRLKKELCAQAQVRHPGIVAVLDQNTDVARPYFVLELLKGNLRERLDQSGGKGLPVPLAIRYFLQLAYALRSAHQSGLTHHNLKPENVLFDAWGNVKIGDFGLSRVIEVDQSKGMPQVFVGTGGMAYMSPELLARSKEPGTASDVYGLGIILYEMLTGQIPGRRSPLPSEVNTDCPSKLDPIFDKMTQDRKENRYPDFETMLDDFYAAFTDGEYQQRGDLLLWSDVPKG